MAYSLLLRTAIGWRQEHCRR